jgi:glycosyltransferase involved in cell wall biosynthesis
MFLSIITPTLNSETHLNRALASVPSGLHLEHIVADGGSTDSTLRLLQQYPAIRVIPGPDQGIYDALNKGLGVASGEVIGFLNSDDYYPVGALEVVINKFRASPELDVLTGHASVFEAASGAERIVTRHRLPSAASLTPETAMLEVPIINARFFRRRIFEKIGCFSLYYPLAADRDFLVRLAISGPASATVERDLYAYRRHSGSRTLDPDGRFVQQFATENCVMAARYHHEFSADLALQSHCLAWHSESTVSAIVAAAKRRRLGDVFKLIGAQRALGSRWQGGLLRAITRKISRRLVKYFKLAAPSE